MPSNFRRSTAAANAEASAVGSLLDGGFLCLYAGTQPASADDVVYDEPLAELRFGNPAFRPAVDGIVRSFPLRAETDAIGDARATWFRARVADGAPVFDGSVGAEGEDADLLLDDVNIRTGARVAVASARYVASKA